MKSRKILEKRFINKLFKKYKTKNKKYLTTQKTFYSV